MIQWLVRFTPGMRLSTASCRHYGLLHQLEADIGHSSPCKQAAEPASDHTEVLGIDDITSLITSKCRILANQSAGCVDRDKDNIVNEEEKDPVKIFQKCWGWSGSDECTYKDSPSFASPACLSVQALGDSAAYSRKQRMVETTLLQQIIGTILQKGWNTNTQEEIVAKIPDFTPFHISYILKGIQEPSLCVRIFEWAREQPGYRHTTRSYNALFGVLAGFSDVTALTRLQNQMVQEGCEPDKVTLCSLIRVYSKAQQPHKVLELYKEMLDCELQPGIVTYSCVIDILARHGYTDKAREVYFEMRMSGCYLDKTGYNILINLFGRKKNVQMVLRLYKDMCEAGLRPDGYTYAALIQTQIKTGDVMAGYKLFLELLDKKLSISLPTCNALIHALGKAEKLDLALKVYNELENAGLQPETLTYSTLISALGLKERIADLHKIIEEMGSKGSMQRAVAYTKAVEWLLHGGSMAASRRLMLEFVQRLRGDDGTAVDTLLEQLVKLGGVDLLHDFLKDLVACKFKLHASTLGQFVRTLCESGNIDGALKIFYAMEELGCLPDQSSYSSVIMGLSRSGSLYQALRFFEDMRQSGMWPDIHTCNHLIHILCIKGDMKAAHEIFQSMGSRGGYTPNVGTYNQLIAGYANLNDWMMAFKVSKEMEDSGFVPNSDTYMPLIFALGNDGRMEHAVHLCRQMLEKGLKPSSQVCLKLLEMLCRKGHKGEAQDAFIKLKATGEFVEFVNYDSFLEQRPC